MIEIERTYLVKKMPFEIKGYQSFKIKQGYLSDLPSPLRIRQRGDKFELTKKFYKDLSDQSTAEEINLSLTELEFRKIWPLTIKSLEKTRYLVPLDGRLTAELDIFHGPLAGLILVEVEFGSVAEMAAFGPPDWFGRDITNEEFSVNYFLAGKTFAEIKNFLSGK